MVALTPTPECTLENQILVEEKYNKYNLIPCLREEVKQLGLDSFTEDLVIHMLICKRAVPKAVVGVLRHKHTNIQAVADNIMAAVAAGYVGWDGERLVTVINVSPEFQAELDLYQFPLPLIIEPKELKTNYDSGYYTKQSSVFLRNNHHNLDARLSHLNRCNAIPLSINMAVANTISNVWKGMNDTADKRRAFTKFDTSARTIMQGLVVVGNKFYLTHKYDKRGRTYCVGYHVTYQGNDWQKASIEFHRKEVVI